LSCEQVARELARSIDFLATSMRDVPARHRSMRAVLEQSWQQLTEDEQQVFCRLSVFEGGFRLDAAQAVVDAPLRVLAGLVEKSMLHVGLDGRYRIHTLLRQLGAEQLAADPVELAGCRARHAAYFMAFLAERRTALTGPEQMDALRDIQAEMDNIRAAWSHAAGQHQILLLGEAVSALFRFLWMRGRYAEGEQFARQALEGMKARELADRERAVQAGLLAERARLAVSTGRYEQALAWSQASLAEAERLCDLPQQAHSQYVAGLIEVELGNGDRAITHLSCAYQLYEEILDTLGMADTRQLLARSHFSRKSQYGKAGEYAAESLRLYRVLGDRFDMGDALNMEAWLTWMAGKPDQAEKLYEECLELGLAVGNRTVVALAHGGLGLIAAAREQWDLAISLLHQRFEQAKSLGYDNEIKHSVNFLCGVYSAAARYAEGITLLDNYPDMWRTPWTAQVQVGTGAFQAAMRYLPEETTQKLAIDHAYDLSLYLVAWAMLLGSNCALKRVDNVDNRVLEQTIARAERNQLMIEVLLAVQHAEPHDPLRNTHAKLLLVNLREKTGGTIAKDDIKMQKVRSLQALAQEMLTIQLG
jgi:tetratricopeptide (TPR) repeat protein